MPTPWNNPSRPSATPMTARTQIARTNTIAPIVTGFWSDIATWTETGKFWNDAGDGSGTIYTTRTLI